MSVAAQPAAGSAAPAGVLRSRAGLLHRALPVLAALLVIAAIVAFGLASTYAGHAAIPQNDDWSYVKSALHLHRTGNLQLQGWGQMFLAGQLYTAQPLLWVFGAKTASLDLYGSIMTAIWLWASFVLARRCVGPWRAVAVVAALALWPGLGLLSSSFMTDMPAWAMSLLTVVVGVRAIERQSRWWLLLALLIGLFSFTIREQMIVGVGAVLFGVLLSRRSTARFRVEAVVAVAVTAVVCALLEHVRHGLPHPDLATFTLSGVDFAAVPITMARLPYTVGLELSPLVAWAVLSLRGRQWLHPGRIAGWVVGVLGLLSFPTLSLTGVNEGLVLGNYLFRSGSFSVAVVGTPPVFLGDRVWSVAQIVAGVSGVLLLGEMGARIGGVRRAWSSLRNDDGLVATMTAYVVLVAGLSVLLAYAGQRQVDRYQIGMLPGLAMMLLAAGSAGFVPSRHRARSAATPELAASRAVRLAARGVTAVTVVVLAAFLAYLSVQLTVRSDRRDHAVWAAADALVRSGVDPTRINAGLDWDGYHSSPVDRSDVALNRYRGEHWTYLFPAATDCWVVSTSTIQRRILQLVRVRHYPGYRIWIYRLPSCRTPLATHHFSV